MYTNYRSPYSNDPYATDDNGDADQLPEQAQDGDPQYDAARQDQQGDLLQNKNNSVDELIRTLAMSVPLGEGIISKAPGTNLLSLVNDSDSSYPSSSDSGYDIPDEMQASGGSSGAGQDSDGRINRPALQEEINKLRGVKNSSSENPVTDTSPNNASAGSAASLKDRYAAYLLATRNQDEIDHMQSAGIPDDELQDDVNTPEFAAFNRQLDAGNVNVSGLYDKAKKIADRLNAPAGEREFTDSRYEAAQQRTPEEAQAFKDEIAAATARHFFDLLKPGAPRSTDFNDEPVDSKGEPDDEELDRRKTQKLHDDISSIVQKIDQLSSDKKEDVNPIDKKEDVNPLPTVAPKKTEEIKVAEVNSNAQKKYQEYRSYFDAAAKAAGVDAASLRAMAKVETGGSPDPATARNGENPGAATGVLQVTPDTWADTVKRHKELAKYSDFSKYSTDPEVNIMVGAFALKDKGDAIDVSNTHPNFDALTITAYNAGQGTINEAIDRAGKDNQKDPEAVALDPKYLRPAIIATRIYKGYLKNRNNPYPPGKPGAPNEKEKQWAIDAKLKEVSQYAPKMYHYKSSEK